MNINEYDQRTDYDYEERLCLGLKGYEEEEMFTIDKIKYHVSAQIIKTIDLCVKLQEKDNLENWLKDCNQEIKRRESNKEDTYPLHYEKAYLEMVISL